MSEKVLIVDDSLTVRMDLHEAFEAAGFHVESCGTVHAARELLRDRAVDVLMLDVLLPDGDGIELLKEVRSSSTESKVVVMMLSTEAEVKDRVLGLRTGADEYVGKPYDSGYVVSKARELLRAQRAGADASLPAEGPANILLIEDSPTFRDALTHALEQAGYIVVAAASGEEGLRAAAVMRPGLVVVDSVLPGMDGPAVIGRLRLDAALRSVPCVLLTGSDDQADELRALDAGADVFVRKGEDIQVILARVAAALRAAPGPMTRSARASSLLGPKRILTVDDSPTYLAELASTLREDGYDVVQAHSGEEAMELLALQTMDCILLDLIMPGMGGRETCRRIKATPVMRDIPLILLTSVEDRDAMLDGLDAGADDYIQKSGEFQVLKARVRAQIRRKQFEDENRRIRMDLMSAEHEAAQARSARDLAESRAELLAQLEQKNRALEAVNAQLRARQYEIAQTNLELTAASQAKSEFLSTMSHELRTPLNAIIGFSELMKDGLAGDLTVRQREFIAHIHGSGGHLLELINDILDLSKIEAGRLEIDLEPVDVDALLDDALSVVRERAHQHAIGLEVRGLGTSQRLQADRRRLKQIVYNLLSNAVKFTPDGGKVSVHASLVDRSQAASSLPGFPAGMHLPLPESPHESFVQVSVSDTGIGIGRDDLKRLFMPFTQIKHPLSRTIEGTGLGLATVSRLAQLQGGTVAVTSEPGLGSCFTLWLPWQTASAPAVVPPPSEEWTALRKPLVLVVEDNVAAAELMRIQLTAAGFEVRHAASAEAALQLVDSCTPDLITLDILLPGMDGWDFLGRIKSLPRWADTPVVVVSVMADHDIGLSLGASAVLQKPIGRGELVHELAKMGFKPTSSRKITVLVVDDDPSAVELMGAYLGQPGYDVLRAYGGQEGIQLAQQHVPDLVLLDLLMPDVGGIEVVEALKRDTRTARIPVIIVTAKQFSEQDRMELNRHVLSVVGKSQIQDDSFMGEVRRAFGRELASQ